MYNRANWSLGFQLTYLLFTFSNPLIVLVSVLFAFRAPSVVWVLADGDDELPHEQWWIIAMIIIAVGLLMGVGGSTRMMLGV